MMKPKQSLLLFMLGLLASACATQQMLHGYPEGAIEMLSPCDDCLVYDIDHDGSTYTMREATGEQFTSFTYRPGGLSIEQSGPTRRPQRLVISQSDELDYAGHQYRFEARYNRRLMQADKSQIDILLIDAEPSLIGEIPLTDDTSHLSGQLHQQPLYYTETKRWEAKSEKREQEGKSVWHQYPAGYLSVIKDNEGMLAEVLEGAQVSQLIGLEGYSGAQYRLQIKDHLSDTKQQAVIVFVLASMFAEQFASTIDQVHDCLGMTADDRLANNCPEL